MIWLPFEQVLDSLLELVILNRIDKRVNDRIRTNHVDSEAIKLT